MHKWLSAISIVCLTQLFSTEEYSSGELIQSPVSEFLGLLGEVEKIYVSPDAVVATGQGLFVKTEDGNQIPIPFLISSENGCFTIMKQNDATVYPVIRCRNCDLPFSPTFFNKGKCPRCGVQN